MSSNTKRQKDIIDNTIENYKNATTAYADYFNGEAPVYIIYYQIADEASRTDSSLEDTHEVIGSNSSLHYYRIKNVPVYGISSLDILTQLTQRGLEDSITGEFIMIPNLGITPRRGEFFSIVDATSPELEQHLFVIYDAQYDRATSKKFFKCSYKLYPLNSDTIYSQVIKNFIYDPNGSGNTLGVGDSVLITEEESAQRDKIESLTDSLIDTFEEVYYNDGMDTFTYQKPLSRDGTLFEYYWSPYLCHFIYKNKVLEKTNQDFLTEIFIQDINESEYPGVYVEKGYRDSIFHAVETDDYSRLDKVYASFFEISAYDLNKPLNLPFFTSPEKYYLLDVMHPFNVDFWLGAFNWIWDTEDKRYDDIDKKYKYYSSDTGNDGLVEYLYNAGAIDADGNPVLNSGFDLVNNTFYQIKDSQSYNDIIGMKRIPNTENAEPFDADIISMITNNIEGETDDLLIQILNGYFTKSLAITDSMISEIENYYFENTIRNYILLPIIIFILKNYTIK